MMILNLLSRRLWNSSKGTSTVDGLASLNQRGKNENHTDELINVSLYRHFHLSSQKSIFCCSEFGGRKYGPTELKDEWDRVVTSIERGEKKIVKQKKLTTLLSKFVSTFKDARNEMTFANKGTTHFSLEQDRALLCAVNEAGYGNWDAVRETIRNDERLKCQHTVQGMTTAMITKHCDYRMRQMERELEAREKFLKSREQIVTMARAKTSAIEAMESWESRTRSNELVGKPPVNMDGLVKDAVTLTKERLAERDPCIARLREIEAQWAQAMAVEEETRQGMYRADQVSTTTYVCPSFGLNAKHSHILDAVRQLFQHYSEISCRG